MEEIKEKQEENKTFIEHLEELRKIVIRSLFAVLIFSILAFIFKKEVLKILIKPLGKELVFLSPTEPIIVLINLSIVLGVILAFPYIIFQIWEFISIIFNKENKIKITKYILTSLLLFYGAIIFCYFAILPAVIKLLTEFNGFPLTSSLTLENYVNFSIYLLLAFGIVFQFPIILFALISMNVISLEYIKTKRRYAILIIFIIAALLPTVDAVSMILIALPMIILFELTLIIAKLKNIRKTSRASLSNHKQE